MRILSKFKIGERVKTEFSTGSTFEGVIVEKAPKEWGQQRSYLVDGNFQDGRPLRMYIKENMIKRTEV